jgi:predicted amidohydrolase YtcJ
MRQSVEGRSLGQNQRISTREALRSYTIGGAHATGRERYLGSIEPGKLADLIALESDPLGMTPVDLGKVKPVATMIGGRWVYSR